MLKKQLALCHIGATSSFWWQVHLPRVHLHREGRRCADVAWVASTGTLFSCDRLTLLWSFLSHSSARYYPVTCTCHPETKVSTASVQTQRLTLPPCQHRVQHLQTP